MRGQINSLQSFQFQSSTMAPAYKLTYFDLPGLGEPIRYLFVIGDIEFEDVRVPLDFAKWPEVKANFPYGVLPILEFDGKIFGQSIALSRYVAKLVGMAPKNALEELEIDSSVDNFNDFKNKLVEYHYCQDEARKETLKKPFLEETLPYYLERFEAQVKKNNGYFVGGKLTWADIYICLPLVLFESYLNDKFVSKYPTLRKLCDLVHSNEKYKKYLANLENNKTLYNSK